LSDQRWDKPADPGDTLASVAQKLHDPGRILMVASHNQLMHRNVGSITRQRSGAGSPATSEFRESDRGQPRTAPGSLVLARRGLASRRPRQRKWDRCRHSDTELAQRRRGFTGQPRPNPTVSASPRCVWLRTLLGVRPRYPKPEQSGAFAYGPGSGPEALPPQFLGGAERFRPGSMIRVV